MDVGSDREGKAAKNCPTYTENLSIWFKEASQDVSHKAG